MFIHDDLQQRWWQLEAKLMEQFGKKPDLNAILFLIGVQEMQWFEKDISKETKQDLMHVAVCTILQPSGYYLHDGRTDDGWPRFHQARPLPDIALPDQENFLKDHILLYFQQSDKG
jgi:hypothetical protein